MCLFKAQNQLGSISTEVHARNKARFPSTELPLSGRWGTLLFRVNFDIAVVGVEFMAEASQQHDEV